MDVVITHNKENHSFITEVEGKISHLKYTVLPDGKTLNYISTYVPSELRGRHIAEQIVKTALEYAKNNNFKVIPTCSYVDMYVKRHPEYKDLIVVFE